MGAPGLAPEGREAFGQTRGDGRADEMPAHPPALRRGRGAGHVPSLGQGQAEVGPEAAPEAPRIRAKGDGHEARDGRRHRCQAKILAARARASTRSRRVASARATSRPSGVTR